MYEKTQQIRNTNAIQLRRSTGLSRAAASANANLAFESRAADDPDFEYPAIRQIAAILEDTVVGQADHPVLVEYGLTHAPCNVFTGLAEIEGVQIHGGMVIPLCDANRSIDNLQIIVQRPDKTFKTLAIPDAKRENRHSYFGGERGDTILVGNHWSSANSVHLATGQLAVAVSSVSDMPAVVLILAAKYPGRKIIVCPDTDTDAADFAALATTVATSGTRLLVARPKFGKKRAAGMKDFNDLHRLYGLEAVRRNIGAAIAPPGALQADSLDGFGQDSVEEEVCRLAALGTIEYEQQRAKAAKKHSLRAPFLDDLVAKERRNQADFSDKESNLAHDPVSWPYEVDGPALLAEMVKRVKRCIVLSSDAALAVALWIIFTHVVDASNIAPILAVLSPVKRCGKTTLFDLLLRLVHRPLDTSNISAADMYRSVDAFRPTLLMDETDTYLKKKPELIGIINSGHRREGASVGRTIDGQHRAFNTYCPKAAAAIGDFPETIRDRSIVIPMRRKSPDESVTRLEDIPIVEFTNLRSRIVRWSGDNFAAISVARPTVPSLANDRAKDNWRPLLAIASCISQDWYDRAVEAAIAMSAHHDTAPCIGEELLRDIRQVLQSTQSDKITTAKLIAALCIDDDKPWSTYDQKRPITPRQLSDILGKFGIAPKNLRFGPDVVNKGYEKRNFEDAFARYVIDPSK